MSVKTKTKPVTENFSAILQRMICDLARLRREGDPLLVDERDDEPADRIGILIELATVLEMALVCQFEDSLYAFDAATDLIKLDWGEEFRRGVWARVAEITGEP